MRDSDPNPLISVDDLIFRAAQAVTPDYFDRPQAEFLRGLQNIGLGPIDARARAAVEADFVRAAQDGTIEVFAIEQYSRREGLVPRDHWREGSLEHRVGKLALVGADQGWAWTALEVRHTDAKRLWPESTPEPSDYGATNDTAAGAPRPVSSYQPPIEPPRSPTTGGPRVRLQDGERFVGDLWPGYDERQRLEILIWALWSGTVRMWARFAAKPRREDRRPALPNLERDGVLGTTTPLPNIEALLLGTDPRAMTCDIPAGRIVISVSDDKKLWGPFNWEPFFPGGATIATGRFLVIELDAIEFDGAAARAYIVENLLPNEATLSGDITASAQPLDSAAPQSEGNVIQFPYHTGLAGRPTSWNLIETECRRQYETGQRHPNDRTAIESPSKWASALIVWLKSAHTGAPVPEKKTLTNKLGALLRQAAKSGPPAAS